MNPILIYVIKKVKLDWAQRYIGFERKTFNLNFQRHNAFCLLSKFGMPDQLRHFNFPTFLSQS